LSKFFKVWQRVMVRPIWFFQNLHTLRSDEHIEYVTINSIILAIGVSTVIFFTQYLNMGLSFLAKVSGIKILIVVPTLLVMGIMFVTMTFLIIAFLLLITFIVLSNIMAAIMHYGAVILRGRGNMLQAIKAVQFSSGVFLVMLIPMFLIFFSKWGMIEPYYLSVGENVIFYLGCIYLYGLLSIASKKIYNIPRWKAFLVAIAPVIFIILVNIVFNLIILPKLGGIM